VPDLVVLEAVHNLQHRGITQRKFGAGEGDLLGDQLRGGW